MKKIINFSVEDYSIEEFDDSGLAKVELYVCHDKHNKNGSYFSIENMIRAQKSIYGRPLLYSMNDDFDDFEEHEETLKLKAAGYISEYSGDLKYEEKNGRIYLVVNAIIWKLYVPEVMAIFERDGVKGISMEIYADKTEKRKDGYIDMIDYKYLGVVLLGEKYQTGMYDTTSELVNFSRNELDEMIEESENILKYRLQKVQRVQEVQKSQRTQEFQKIMKEESLMFDREKHAEKFKMTSNDIRSAMRNELYSQNEYEVYFEDYCAEYVYAYEYNESSFVGIPYKIEDSKISLDFGCKKKMKYEFVEVEEMSIVNFAKELIEKHSEDFNKQIKDLEENLEKEKETFAKKEEDLSKQLEDLKVEFNDKETEKVATVEEKDNAIFALDEKVKGLEENIASKDEELTSLNSFKLEREKEVKDEKVVALFGKLSSKLTKTEIEDWKEKESKYESFEDFEKDISKFALDKILSAVETDKTNFSRMHVKTEDGSGKSEEVKDVWDKL